MMTTSSFMSTLTAFAFVVGSLLRIALKVSIFSSLIHSHKLKVRSGLLEAAALFKFVLISEISSFSTATGVSTQNRVGRRYGDVSPSIRFLLYSFDPDVR